MKMEELSPIAYEFGLEANQFDIHVVKKGHINDSYVLQNKVNERPYYFLQKINHHIFPEVEKLMENIIQVSDWIHEMHQSTITCPKFLAVHGKYHLYHNDQYFRISNYLRDYEVLDQNDVESIYVAGNAYGRFVNKLGELSPKKLHVTIPNFHNLTTRKKQLETALSNVNQKNQKIGRLVSIVSDLVPEVSVIQNQIDKQAIPMRICHCDTKVDNILRHKENKDSCAVVDLDTVMPNSILFDYGDAIRSVISYSKEDENIEKPMLNLDNFQAFHFGYMDEIHEFITTNERELLSRSIVLMPLIMGIRFLTDYINGNQYYKVQNEHQNLDRASNQIFLAKQLWQIRSELEM